MGTTSSFVVQEYQTTSLTPGQTIIPVYGGFPVQMATITTQQKPQPPKPKPIMIDEDMVEEYVRMESNIRKCEKNKPLEKLDELMRKIQKLFSEIQNLEAKLQQQQCQTDVEDVDSKELIKEIDEVNVGSVKNNFKGLSTKNDSDKVKEVLEFELNNKRKQYDECDKELEQHNILVAELLDNYIKQDELLMSIFSKGLASVKEKKLLEKLCEQEEKQKRVAEAKCLWKESQLVLEYGCKKLAYAVKLWQNLDETPKICLEVRYSLSEELERKMREMGRSLELDEELNNLPNCTKEELTALEALATGTSCRKLKERDFKNMENYSESCKQAISILKFLGKILNITLYRDLTETCEDVRLTSQAIRVERRNVLMQMLKEKYGTDFDMEKESIKIGAEKVIHGYKEKIQAKKAAKPRRGSNSSMNGVKIAPRRGSQGKITALNNNLNNGGGGAEQKAKARMEKRLGQQLSEQKQLRERKASALPPPPPPAAAPATEQKVVAITEQKALIPAQA